MNVDLIQILDTRPSAPSNGESGAAEAASGFEGLLEGELRSNDGEGLAGETPPRPEAAAELGAAPEAQPIEEDTDESEAVPSEAPPEAAPAVDPRSFDPSQAALSSAGSDRVPTTGREGSDAETRESRPRPAAAASVGTSAAVAASGSMGSSPSEVAGEARAPAPDAPAPPSADRAAPPPTVAVTAETPSTPARESAAPNGAPPEPPVASAEIDRATRETAGSAARVVPDAPAREPASGGSDRAAGRIADESSGSGARVVAEQRGAGAQTDDRPGSEPNGERVSRPASEQAAATEPRRSFAEASALAGVPEPRATEPAPAPSSPPPSVYAQAAAAGEGARIESAPSVGPPAPTSGPAPAPAADAIAVQTEWLATRGGGQARLLLHPPELGELAVRVTLRGDAVEVVMVAQEGAARAIAMEQSDRLAEAFASRELRMEQFEVRRADGAAAGGDDPEAFRDASAGHEHGARSDDGRDGSARGSLESRSSEGAETPPVVLMSSAAQDARAGVDLRI